MGYPKFPQFALMIIVALILGIGIPLIPVIIYMA